jgi:hypothetical protein
MEQSPTELSGQWTVEDDGSMAFIDDESGKIIFELTPELLEVKTRVLEMTVNPLVNRDLFFLAYLKACRNAGLKQITILIE